MCRNTKTIIAVLCISIVSIAASQAAVVNLLTNGDFELGNTGFTTALTTPGIGVGAGFYDITTDPLLNHSLATSYGDHTTGSGLMMAVNGSNIPGQVVWAESGIAVAANTNHDFAAHISSWFPDFPAQLKFFINGVEIGDLTAPTVTGQWDLIFSTWNSGAATTASIEILNTNTVTGGNDFALDDIYFGEEFFSVAAVPEPSTYALILTGLIGLTCMQKRRRSTHNSVT